MGKALQEWAKHEKRKGQQKKELQKPLSVEERRSLQLIRLGARKVGSELRSGGKGGLPPSLVLAVMRRDGFTCKVCGELGSMKDNGGLEVHHKGGIVESKWLSSKGHKNEKNNIVSICHACHDRIHNAAREEGVDSSQVQAEADKGGR